MEFNTEWAPYLRVSYTSDLIQVQSQLAGPPLPYPSCKSNLLDYDVYHLYLPERDFSGEAYFQGVRRMLTPNRIEQYARKVGSQINVYRPLLLIINHLLLARIHKNGFK